MKPKKIAAAAVLFLTSAALPFALLAPRTATSGTRAVTVNGGCTGSGQNYTCLGVVGTDFNTANLDGAWFELSRFTANSMTVTARLKRATYTGTVSMDTASATWASGGHGEIFVTAVNTKQNGWQYDFLWSEFSSTHTAWGPLGVFYEFN
jgi:hypothetical protein